MVSLADAAVFEIGAYDMTEMGTRLEERRQAISEAREGRREEAWQKYWGLVVATAENRFPSPEETIDILLDSDRGEEDLERDAERYSLRTRHRAILDQREQAEKQSAELEQQIREKREALAAIVREKQAEIFNLETAFGRVQGTIGSAVSSERALCETCWPWVIDEEKQVLARLQELNTIRTELEDRIRKADSVIRQATRLAESEQNTPAMRKHNAEVAAHQQAERERLQAELDAVLAKVAEANGELNRVHQRKLVP